MMAKRKNKRRNSESIEIKDTSSENCPYEFNSFVHDKKYGSKAMVYCVKFNKYHDGYIFATAILNKILIFDAEVDMTLLQAYEMRGNEVIYALDWSKDSETNEMVLVAGGQEGALYDVFKARSFGEEIFALRSQKISRFDKKETKNEAINDIKFSPSIEYLFAVAGSWGRMYLCNIKTQIVIAEFHANELGCFPEQIIAVSFDPTGDFIACTGANNIITVWDLKNNQYFQKMLNESSKERQPDDPYVTQLIPNYFGCIIKGFHHNYIDSIIWFGKLTLFTKSADGEIVLWHLKLVDETKFPIFLAKNVRPTRIFSFRVPDSTFWFVRMTLNREANMLAIGNNKGQVIVYDLEANSFEEIKNFTISTSASHHLVRAISFSHDSKMLVYCTDNGAVFKHELKGTKTDENMNVDEIDNIINESTNLDSSSSLENEPKRQKIIEG